MAERQTGAASSTSGGTVTVVLGGNLRDTGDLGSDTPRPGPLVPEAEGVSPVCGWVGVCVCVSHWPQRLRESHGGVSGALPVSYSPPGPGLPTCLICVCLGSSVYCDDADLENIPPLPQTTAYLYARFNRISHIRAGDFKGLSM